MKKTLRILSLTALFSLTLAGCGEKPSSLPSVSSPVASEPVSLSTPSVETPSSSAPDKKTSTAKAFYTAFKKAYDVTAKATALSATQTLTSSSLALKGSATVRPEAEESEDTSSSVAPTPSYDTYAFDVSTTGENITTALAGSGLKETDFSKYKFSFTSSGKAGYSVKVDTSSSQSEEMGSKNLVNDSLASSDYAIGAYVESGNLYFDFSDATIQKLLGKLLTTSYTASSTPIDTKPYSYLMVSDIFASAGMMPSMPTWNEIDGYTRTSIDTFVDSFDDNSVLKSIVSFTSLDGVEEMKVTISKAVVAYLPAALKAYALSELATQYPDKTSDEYKSGEAQINTASTILSKLASATTVNKFVLTFGLSEDGFSYSTSDIDVKVENFSVNDTVDMPNISLDDDGNPTISQTDTTKTYINFALDNFTFKTSSSITYGYEDIVVTKPNKTYLSLTSGDNA